MLKMTTAELTQFIAEHFPEGGASSRISRLDEQGIELRLPFHERYLRPGGTISGPTLMGLADTSAYMLILSRIGPVALAVTTSLNINFMRRPPADEVVATGKLLKLGRQLAVVEVYLTTARDGLLVAQASVTYSLPPAERR
jgi:uncharacterized protein (TIGR00369 family)